MIVQYDPFAGELGVYDGHGACWLDTETGHVLIKQYRSEGILYCELRGEEAELAFYDPAGQPDTLALVPSGPGRWRVVAPAAL